LLVDINSTYRTTKNEGPGCLKPLSGKNKRETNIAQTQPKILNYWLKKIKPEQRIELKCSTQVDAVWARADQLLEGKCSGTIAPNSASPRVGNTGNVN